MNDGDEDIRNGSDYDRGTSDEWRRSETELNAGDTDGDKSDERTRGG